MRGYIYIERESIDDMSGGWNAADEVIKLIECKCECVYKHSYRSERTREKNRS